MSALQNRIILQSGSIIRPRCPELFAKKLIFGRFCPGRPILPGTASDGTIATQKTGTDSSVSHAQLARHEWLQFVVNSQWERDSYRGYISAARHRARLAPGLKVRSHVGAEWRTVMM